MVVRLEGDAAFYAALARKDRELLEEARREPCQHCSGPLHCGNYPRKPRGDLGDSKPLFESRFSLCCGRLGCRKRLTPPSVRFLGRKVYVGAVVMLASVVWQELVQLGAKLGKTVRDVPLRTVRRWVSWWRGDVSLSAFWKATKARFLPPVNEDALVSSLVERFGSLTESNTFRRALELLTPLTTKSAPNAMGP